MAMPSAYLSCESITDVDGPLLAYATVSRYATAIFIPGRDSLCQFRGEIWGPANGNRI